MINKHQNLTIPLKYDPSWIVKLAENQYPDDENLIEALKKCKIVVGFCECGCGDPYFIDPNSKEWDFDDNLELLREDDIPIILDIMKDGRVGSLEICEWGKKS